MNVDDEAMEHKSIMTFVHNCIANGTWNVALAALNVDQEGFKLILKSLREMKNSAKLDMQGNLITNKTLKQIVSECCNEDKRMQSLILNTLDKVVDISNCVTHCDI